MKVPSSLIPIAAVAVTAAALLAPQFRGSGTESGKAPAPSTSGQSAQHTDQWRVIGPGGGGALFNAAISPLDPNLMLIACDMGGSYITHDAGKTWRIFNLHGRQRFAFDPRERATIYSYGGRFVWRSTDSGETWEMFFPAPSDVQRTSYVDVEGMLAPFTAKGLTAQIGAFSIDPADNKTFYMALGHTVEMSRDGGKSWKALGAGRNALRILVDPASPRDNRTLYVIESDGSSIFSDGKMTANPVFPGKIKNAEAAGGAFAEERSAVYAALGGRLLLSLDGGKTWSKAAGTMGKSPDADDAPPGYAALAVAQNNPSEVYLSYKFPGGPFGVAHTTDSGASWSLPWKNGSAASPGIHDAWISKDLGPAWGENPLTIATDPQDAKRLLAGDYGRCLRSDDSGRTWNQCYSVALPDGTFTTNGLNTTESYGVHFDPFDLHRMFITCTDIGLFRSENGGESWSYAMNGVPRAWRNTAYWMEFDREVKGRAWMAVSGLHDLPWENSVRRLDTAKGGVMVTTDGGKSWSKSGNLPEGAYTHVLLDGRNHALYVTGMGRGVFKSSDGGASWQLKAQGLPESPLAWRLVQSQSGTLLLTVVRRRDDDREANAGGVYQSTDGGEHWSKLPLPSGVSGPMTVTVDPDNPNRFYLAAWGHSDIYGHTANGGVFVSVDGGLSWKNIFSADQRLYDVTVDPKDPNTVYASGFQASVWRSIDRGLKWQRVRGFNFNAANRVFPDPMDASKIYVTTFGGGIWHGPATGDANAREDIVTPQVAYQRK